MKGQMFIITIVFLIGMIFAVQGNLSGYNFLDLADSFKRNDLSILLGVRGSFEEALKTGGCQETSNNLQELESFLESRVIQGFSIEIDHSFDCPTKTLTLTTHLKSIEMDTRQTITLTG